MLKRVAQAIGLGVAVLLVVILVRTAGFDSHQIQVADGGPVTLPTVNEQVIEQLSQAIQFPTISLDWREPERQQVFRDFHAFLRDQFPRTFSTLSVETVNELTLLLHWPGQDAALEPMVWLAHQDVVPVEASTESRWQHPPFAGTFDGEYLWGRGALDDKHNLIAMLAAVEQLLHSGFQPQRGLYLMFGHDEEIGGRDGALPAAKLLQERGVRAHYVLDEGTPLTEDLIPGFDQPVALVATAQKGYMSLELTVEAEGGHSSMPEPRTSVGLLAEAIARLEANPFPLRMTPPVRAMFEYLGAEMTFPKKAVMANLWLFEPLLVSQMSGSPASRALLHTTTAATVFQAGAKDNIIPKQARAIVNFRLLAGDASSAVLEHVRTTINDERVRIKLLDDAAEEASPISPHDNAAFASLQRTLHDVRPEALVAPSMLIAITDSRHFEALSDSVYRFNPVYLNRADLPRVHGLNERIHKDELQRLVQFYLRLAHHSQ